MVTVISRFMSHINYIFHICRSFETLVGILFVVSPHCSFSPLLCSGRFSKYAFLPLVQIINDIVVIIFSKEKKNQKFIEIYLQYLIIIIVIVYIKRIYRSYELSFSIIKIIATFKLEELFQMYYKSSLKLFYALFVHLYV